MTWTVWVVPLNIDEWSHPLVEGSRPGRYTATYLHACTRTRQGGQIKHDVYSSPSKSDDSSFTEDCFIFFDVRHKPCASA
jgi:hypothetical protein